MYFLVRLHIYPARLFDDRRRWKTDDDEGNDDDSDDHGGQLLEFTQSTDDGFAEDILIKSKLLSLSQVVCWSGSDFRLNAVG
jgi:hypothetical protein